MHHNVRLIKDSIHKIMLNDISGLKDRKGMAQFEFDKSFDGLYTEKVYRIK